MSARRNCPIIRAKRAAHAAAVLAAAARRDRATRSTAATQAAATDERPVRFWPNLPRPDDRPTEPQRAAESADSPALVAARAEVAARADVAALVATVDLAALRARIAEGAARAKDTRSRNRWNAAASLLDGDSPIGLYSAIGKIRYAVGQLTNPRD